MFLFQDNWQPGQYYYVFLYAMIMVMFIVWLIQIIMYWMPFRSSFESNIMMGTATSGADLRPASRPSAGYSAFMGRAEAPVYYSLGDVGATREAILQAQSEGFDRWATEKYSDAALQTKLGGN